MTTAHLDTAIGEMPDDFFTAINRDREEIKYSILKEHSLGCLTLEAHFSKWMDSVYEINQQGMLVFDNKESMYLLNLDYRLDARGMQRYYNTDLKSWVVTDGDNLYPFNLPIEAFKPMEDLFADIEEAFS